MALPVPAYVGENQARLRAVDVDQDGELLLFLPRGVELFSNKRKAIVVTQQLPKQAAACA